jgi:A/G-specific adenine glycosylase
MFLSKFMHSDEASIEDYQRTLLAWWKDSARDFPWRHNRSPYCTAIAELMLRRTQANQVVKVFEEFVDKFPVLSAASQATPEALRRILYPLGLEWRASTMIDFIHQAHLRFGNDLPLNETELRTLPGVGDYVAAAIVCFAGEQASVLIDTNVVRVLGRIFGVDTSGEARRRKSMRDIAERTIFKAKPADYHYALLDFAALVCTARSPKCTSCPFSINDRCDYFREDIKPMNLNS